MQRNVVSKYAKNKGSLYKKAYKTVQFYALQTIFSIRKNEKWRKYHSWRFTLIKYERGLKMKK